jgi:hypothetical protein
MTTVNKNRHALFAAPSEDGLRLSGMFVLPGHTFRCRWQVKGWGWVVAKTTGELIEKQTHLFFGETNLEFRLQLGQQIDIHVINPFGRVSKRFVAVANIDVKPELPSQVTEHIFSTQFVVDTQSSSKLMRPNFVVLDSLHESLSQKNIPAPDVVRVKPFNVKCIQPRIDSQALKIPSLQFRKFNIAKHWKPEWEYLSAMASNSDTNKGVLNVYQ